LKQACQSDSLQDLFYLPLSVETFQQFQSLQNADATGYNAAFSESRYLGTAGIQICFPQKSLCTLDREATCS
jgi:hypothetical protein